MRVLLYILLLSCALFGTDPPQDNVNSKYSIEAVEIIPSTLAKHLNATLRSEMDALIGQKFDQAVIDALAGKIGKQVHRKVEHRVEKGTKPDHVRVVYLAPRVFEADADVSKLVYHSKHGITAGLETTINARALDLHLGLQSDSDTLLERYAGYSLGASRSIGDRVRLRLDFESFHQQWNATTLRELEGRPDLPGVYRERYHVAPSITINILEPLSLTAGVDIQHFQTQFPAARFEAANAVTTTLRYRRRWALDASRQEVDAGYGLRAATRSLDSDYAYARHAVTAEYKGVHGNQTWSVHLLAGSIGGQAPLFERFTLGDSRTLRGWSKFDVAPLGGSRVAHGSLEYTFHWLGVFYDTGSVWAREEKSGTKHSVGFSLGGRDGFFVALAFPLRNTSMQPLFILGTNF